MCTVLPFTILLRALIPIQEAEDKLAEQIRQEHELRNKRDVEAGPSRVLADAILSRGIRVCTPQVRLESR